MKKAFQTFWKQYFNFTKGERNAFFVLLFITAIFILIPFILPPKKWAKTDFSEFEKYENQIDTSTKKEFVDYTKQYAEYPTKTYTAAKTTKFLFNPNTANVQEFEKLGIPTYVANRILKFRGAGAVFYIKADFKKIYGLDENLYNDLYPYINLPETKTYTPKPFDDKPSYQPKTYALIDINTADTATLNRLPGIGNVLSARIVVFRDKLGGFYSFEQLGEVYGLKPEVLEKIKPKLKADFTIQKYININTATAAELAQHPYIKKKFADIIVNYRQQHGNYTKAEDLLKTKIIDEATVNKLRGYLRF